MVPPFYLGGPMDIIKRFKELRASGMNFIDAKTIVLKETGAIIDKLVEM